MELGKNVLLGAVGLMLLAGCGSGAGGGAGVAATGADGEAPKAVMTEFLNAIRQGDDDTASALLTNLARQKAEELEMVVAPPGSETASFEILAVEVEGQEAQVGTDWSDLDANGQPHTDRIVWLLREEASGWRIHGMATRVFADLDPIVLNFEDPADMLRKQQEAEAELARREAQAAATNAAKPADDSTTIR